MLHYLLDTDHLTLYQHGQSLVTRRVALQRGKVGLCIVTIEEALRGWLAVLAQSSVGIHRIRGYDSLARTLLLFNQFPTIPYDQTAEDEFQQLDSVRIGTRDRKIASIALANRLIVVTRNRRDFARVPGLTNEDWSV
ncbi:MAG: type II toxin-antitoxin system VapC family toxin [Isosphaeraceae bacterium]